MSPSTGSDIYVGLMSGTSVDGVDIAIVDFSVQPPGLLYSSTTPFDDSLRQRIQAICGAQSSSLDELYRLDAELGEYYAAVVNRALAEHELNANQVDAIGCHGQTVRHSPDSPTPFTAQLGDPNRLAALTGITTVADFRRKDIALGGQGAPLAPALHRQLFRSDDESRVVVNIGGIANLTYLPSDPGQAVLGFDTGPGNTLMDSWILRHQRVDFDRDGEWARGGRVIDALLEQLVGKEAYFNAPLPKTTGTGHFNLAWLEPHLSDAYAAEDVQATLAELTATTLAQAASMLPSTPASWFVCGGGARNRYLLERIAAALPRCHVDTTAALGLDPDYVEAVAFAWLARERLQGRPGNLIDVTRASRPALLGAIYAAD